MSMELMVKAMKCKVGNPLRKLVLLKLADNANDQGECWPSYQYIADQCEISKRSVINHIGKLIDAGLLRKETRKGGPKGNASNIYIINFSGAGNSLGVLHDIHPTSATDSPPPSATDAPRTSHSLEPVIEPKDLLEVEILNYLNLKRIDLYESLGLPCRKFRTVDSHLTPIKTVLRAKYDVEQIKLVIDHLVVRWGNDPEMRDYLSPSSIFRKTKFESKLDWAQAWLDAGRPCMKSLIGKPAANDLDWNDKTWADDGNWEL